MKSLLPAVLLLLAHLSWAQAVSTSAGASPGQSITVVSTIPASAVELRAPSRPSPPRQRPKKRTPKQNDRSIPRKITKPGS